MLGRLVLLALLTWTGRSQAVDELCNAMEDGEANFQRLKATRPWDGSKAGKYEQVMDAAGSVEKCAQACCDRETCHVAFLFAGRDCYALTCASAQSCRPKPTDKPKHADSVFVQLRPPPPPLAGSTTGKVAPAEAAPTEEDSAASASLPLGPSKRPNQGLQHDAECGSDLGICSPPLVCKGRCACPTGSVWTGGNCSQVAAESGGPATAPKPCSPGMKDCPANEECSLFENSTLVANATQSIQVANTSHIDQSNSSKSRHGVCKCIAGLRRSGTTGRCDVKIDPLKVEILGEAEVSLPLPSFRLKANIVSELEPGVEPTFHWSLEQRPPPPTEPPPESQTETQELSSQDWLSQELTVSHLRAGRYLFRVKVTAGAQEASADFALSVLPEPQPNQPPEARIDPPDPTIVLVQGKSLILEGSESRDPDGPEGKPTAYEWTQVSGPAIPNFSGSKSENLKFESLLPGNYSFALTVTDDAGAKDTKKAMVFVKAERDDPPEAIAGECGVGKPPGDFSVTQQGSLEEFTFNICGNASRDDKKIVKWAWSQPAQPDSDKDPVDLTGTAKPVLTVSNAMPGTYAFKLRVEDGRGQSHETTLRVHVNPATNRPPVADVGKNITMSLPLSSLLLDGTQSHDDASIKSWSWEQVSGPSKARLANADKATATASELVFGLYAFRLNVSDEQGLTSSAILGVNVTRSSNKPPLVVVPDVSVSLPASMAVLDGSRSSDDAGIVEWRWSLADESPATLTVLGRSDREERLLLGALEPGKYRYRLRVKDQAGAAAEAIATLSIQRSLALNQSVELYLGLSPAQFSQATKAKLLKLLESLLSSAPQLSSKAVEAVRVNLSQTSIHSTTGQIRLVFFAWYSDGTEKILPAGKVAAALDEHSANLEPYRLRRLETLFCKNDCSGHGVCDDHSKLCVCERFWMPNLLAVHALSQPSNCAWSVLYALLFAGFGTVACLGSAWWLWACRRRRSSRPGRRRRFKLGDKSYRKLRNGTRRSLLHSGDGSSSEEASAAPNGLIALPPLSSSSSSDDGDNETIFSQAAAAAAPTGQGVKSRRA